MELTHEIIDMTYRFTRTYLRRIGRTDIETHDLAHDALVKIAKATPVALEHIKNRVWLDVKSAFRDVYTNTTTRKHNVLLDAVYAEFDMETTDPNTVEVMDEFSHAMRIVHKAQPTQYEILMLMLDGMTVSEIARMRDTSTQAVYEIQKKARITVKTILADAA